MKYQPLVSIILVSYNSEEYILDCLNSLSAQNYKNFNIIFVDNNSSDNSVQIVKKDSSDIITICNKNNYGFPKACNIGFQKAFEDKNVKYVICLNIDTTLDENWLEELVKVAEIYPDAGSVQSKILLHDNPQVINTAANNLTFLGFGYCGNYLEKSSVKTEIEEIPYSSGTSVLYSRKALEQAGFFDEDYFLYHEDVDLGIRLKLFGFKNFLVPKSICYHKYAFPKQNKVYFLERNRLISLFKNFSFKTLLIIFPAFLINEIGLVIFILLTGNFSKKMESYFYFFKNIFRIIVKRRHIQKNRAINDREIAKLLVSRIEFQELDFFLLKKAANPFFDLYWKIAKKLI
ncbi:MAG: glycosyltransferase family 2 protein [Candidatus Cloacimonetes bacterium]|nr:glycosyltransferase family 2 protein [Candidatus Cloacimonadota bacterium]MCF7884801.1 glycosyltransferase family 2 protein [Candidatus Cloacimonadota bacterium]